MPRMDNLLKQVRVRFSDTGEDPDKQSYTREGRMAPQKTVSFKGERKRTNDWFQRQFSGQMSGAENESDSEFAATIAAAAYAINLLAEGGSLDQKGSAEGLESSLTKAKSKKEDRKPTDYSQISRWLSGKEAKEDGRSIGESRRKSVTLDQRMKEDSTADRKMPEKEMGTTATVKKIPTFSDNYLNDTGSKKFEHEQDMRPGKPDLSTTKPSPSSSGNGFEDGNRTGREETKAGAWEREKMAKIKKRYEKMNTEILEWENAKKLKARRRQERKEGEIEERRARVLQEYRNEISRIDKITSGARAVSDERKRNDEIKIKEKTNTIRSTGKVPRTCFCF